MLGSCSSSDDLNGGGNNTGSNQSGNGYVAFNIHLPSQSGSSSRAANDEFKDGMKSEYDVKDATLLIFEGSSESAAEFKGAYKLNTAPWTAPVPDGNITTTSATIVKQINTPTSASDCYALVVLNNNGVFSVDEANKTITLDGKTTTFSGTYKDFAESLSDKNLTQTGFYMANAPLADAPGGSTSITSVNVKTLVSLDGKIMATESAAKGAPADIYVERGVAKVTMQSPSTTLSEVEGSKPYGTSSKVAFSLTDWCLDNTNTSTYLVRSTEDFDKWANLCSNSTSVSPDKYRFVGSKPVATGLYRTYFAKDANYTKTENEAALAANELSTTTSPVFVSKFGDENPQYCFENTFNVESQLDHFTTRVLIKAKLNSGATFYVFNGDQNTIYPIDEVKKEIKKYFLIENEAWIKANVRPATGKTDVDGDDLDVEITDAAGKVSITSITFKTGATGVTIAPSATVPTNYDEVLERIGTIDEYIDGESYYFVRIKHFGDDLTPWKKNETPQPSTSGVYPTGVDQAGNYLGRYGVLRNNWYDIAVDGVKGLGSSTVPKVTPTTDDELKSYIAVRINVLSWAKRTQGATLGE